MICLPSDVLQQKLGNVGSVGMGQAMKLKWITLDKSSGQPVVKRKVSLEWFVGYQVHRSHLHHLVMQASEITDGVQQVLQSIAAGKAEVCQRHA